MKNPFLIFSTNAKPSLDNWEILDTTLPTILTEDQGDILYERGEIYTSVNEQINIESSNFDLQKKMRERKF